MQKSFGVLAASCMLIIAALLVVGVVADELLRHIVQTAPVWIPVALAVRRSGWSKWAALPCAVFWLLLMGAIWLYLLGWARLISGTFSPTEVAMTIIVGLGAVAAIVAALSMRTRIKALPAVGVVVLIAVVQLVAVRVSFLPQIAHR